MSNESLAAKIEKKIYDIIPHEPEEMAATLFVIGMAAYYMWRVFAITPVYDELYAYCEIIEKGPLFAALNWPSEGNHVGYSVLAAIVNLFAGPYIGLRGISFVCAVSNLILVYRICRRYFSHALPLGGMVLYASMQVVNEYSVQGRGFTLATFCFLLSVSVVTRICSASEIKNYQLVAYIFCMVFGIYTVPMSIYWFVPVCISTLLYLFINGFRSRSVYESDAENIYLKKLNTLMAATGIGIVITFVLYLAMWLMIGARLLAQQENSQYFGKDSAFILIRNPLSALGSGVEFMTERTRAERMGKDLFKAEFAGWLKDLLNYMIPGLWLLLAIFIVFGVGIMALECIRHFEYSRTSINLLAVVNIFYVIVILISTHNLPALTGFGYGSFIMTICVLSTIEKIINVSIRFINNIKNRKNGKDNSLTHRETEYIIYRNKWYDGIGVYVPVVIIFALFFVRFFGSSYNGQVGLRENEIYNTLYIADVSNRSNPCALDATQKYLMKFGWDIDCRNYVVMGSDMVILDKDYVDDFEYFYDPEALDLDYLESMHIQYESESLILYTKVKER